MKNAAYYATSYSAAKTLYNRLAELRNEIEKAQDAIDAHNLTADLLINEKCRAQDAYHSLRHAIINLATDLSPEAQNATERARKENESCK